ncbi:MAG TPA: hypothetical protein P5525_03480 [Candidatus Paceibacterota bacterium]|nr:hypothetical protein [Candidatus Paceibacterota bacterium]
MQSVFLRVELGQTLSRVTIRKARAVGVSVNATAVVIEDLVVENQSAFDIVEAEFSAAGVREISFGNTYPVKASERRGGRLHTERGGWVDWLGFVSQQHGNKSALIVRPAAKRHTASRMN